MVFKLLYQFIKNKIKLKLKQTEVSCTNKKLKKKKTVYSHFSHTQFCIKKKSHTTPNFYPAIFNIPIVIKQLLSIVFLLNFLTPSFRVLDI